MSTWPVQGFLNMSLKSAFNPFFHRDFCQRLHSSSKDLEKFKYILVVNNNNNNTHLFWLSVCFWILSTNVHALFWIEVYTYMFRSIHPCICQFSMDVFSYSRGHWAVLEPVPAVFGRMLGSPRTSHQFIVGGAGVPGGEPSDRENMFRSILEIRQFSSILILLILSLIVFNDRKTVQIPPQIHQSNSLILSYFLGKSDLIPKVTNMNFEYQLL